MKTALVAGSTGLIGKQLIKSLLESGRYNVVKALTRTAIGFNHPKLQEIKVDYGKLDEVKAQLVADDVFCALGTTMAKAKTKKKFREIDFVYPLSLAKIAVENKSDQFFLVSALGANKRSSVFYNHVKGDLEEAVSDLRFEAIHIFRPSLLLGDRSERRSGEDAAKIFYRVFWFLIPAKYAAIDSAKVARAMVSFAAKDQRGVFVHESREMQGF